MKIKNKLLFGISMALLALFCYSMISQIRFLSRAEHGVGVVREVRAVNGRCGGKRKHSCTKFFATVEFQAAGSGASGELEAGDARGHDQPLSRASHQVGQSVPIVFDPNRPEEVHHDELWELWRFPLALLLFLVFTLVGSLTQETETDEPVTLKLGQGS